jgi:hypothetical protein
VLPKNDNLKGEIVMSKKSAAAIKKMVESKPGMEVKPVPNMEEIKQVVGGLLQNFVKEEAGNKVTTNNISGLAMNLMQALDGNITMTKPEETPPSKG